VFDGEFDSFKVYTSASTNIKSTKNAGLGHLQCLSRTEGRRSRFGGPQQPCFDLHIAPRIEGHPKRRDRRLRRGKGGRKCSNTESNRPQTRGFVLLGGISSLRTLSGVDGGAAAGGEQGGGLSSLRRRPLSTWNSRPAGEEKGLECR